MRSLILAATLLVVVLPLCAAAQGVPRTMSYQGYLSDAAGQPVADGTYRLTFTLYNGEFAGGTIWTETQPSVQVTRGLFAVVLGDVTPLSAAFDTQYWLGVKIGNDAELAPRVKLATTAYSHRAREADGIAVGTITNAHVAAGANIAASKLAPELLTQSEVSAGIGIGVQVAGDGLLINATDVPASAIQPDIVSSISGVSNDGGNIELVAGANVTITPDAASRQITIAASGGGGGLTLPFSGQTSTSAGTPALGIRNDGSGIAGFFMTADPAGQSSALRVTSNATGDIASAITATAAGGKAIELMNNSAMGSTIYALNSGTGSVADLHCASNSPGNVLQILKNGGTGCGISLTYSGTGSAMYVDNNSSGVGLELKQDGTGNAAYFHIDNTTSTQNSLRASSVSTSTASDAIEAVAVGGNAVDAKNNSASSGTIIASNTNSSTTAPCITTSGGFRTDRSGKTTSQHFVATENLGSGTPDAGGTYKDNVVCAWANVTPVGTASGSFGCTTEKLGAGRYRINYNNPFSSSNDAVPVATAYYSSGPRIAVITINGAASVVVETYSISGILTDTPFHIIVLGRQ
jgi:hypothetical protein